MSQTAARSTRRRAAASKTTTAGKNGARKPANGESEQPSEEVARLAIKTRKLAPKRPYVTIDDDRHELRLLSEFGHREHQEYDRYSEEYDELYGTDPDQLNEEQLKRMDWLLEWLFEHSLADPGRLREQLDGDDPETGEPWLTDGIKREIALTFSKVSAPVSPAAAQLMALAQLMSSS